MKLFGCTTYSWVSIEKLQPMVQTCVMLGYPQGIKGYKLLVIQPNGYIVITTRSVTVNENDFHYKLLLTNYGEKQASHKLKPNI